MNHTRWSFFTGTFLTGSACWILTTLNALKTSLENAMLDLDVRGKIRLSPEGINGTAAGKESRVKQFEREMKSTKGKFAILELQGVDFKRERVNARAFRGIREM